MDDRIIRRNEADAMNTHLTSGLADEFRVLKSHIVSRRGSSLLKTVMITSAVEREGVSTIALNLARAVAEDGLKVMLVDANYRAVVPNKLYGNADFIAREEIKLNGSTLRISSMFGMKNFVVMSPDSLSGDDDNGQSNWLSKTKKLISLINYLKESFDMVFIDSSPILNHSESLMIGSHMDGVILTVHADVTKRQLVIKAKDELLKANASILGVVLNRKKHIIPPFFYKRM